MLSKNIQINCYLRLKIFLDIQKKCTVQAPPKRITERCNSIRRKEAIKSKNNGGHSNN